MLLVIYIAITYLKKDSDLKSINYISIIVPLYGLVNALSIYEELKLIAQYASLEQLEKEPAIFNITDEELQQALDAAKANESLFSKQVASLRVYYKDLEQKKQQQLELEQQQKAEQEFETFTNNIVESIKNFNSLEDTPVELSHEEMEDLANYILTRDDSGYSEFGRLLNDPMQFTKAAFWMLKGPEILNEMQKQIKEAYLRGYNETHKTTTPKKVFTKPTSPNRNSNNESQFAYFDEDSYLND